MSERERFQAGRFEDDELPIDELRAAWRGARAPEPADDLADGDAVTRASVEWMRGAWRDLELPPVRVPDRAPVLQPTFGGPAWVAAAITAAAAGFLFVAWFAARERTGIAQPRERVATEDGTEADASEEGSGERAQPELVSVGANNIEWRSGSVTLVLVTSSS